MLQMNKKGYWIRSVLAALVLKRIGSGHPSIGLLGWTCRHGDLTEVSGVGGARRHKHTDKDQAVVNVWCCPVNLRLAGIPNVSRVCTGESLQPSFSQSRDVFRILFMFSHIYKTGANTTIEKKKKYSRHQENWFRTRLPDSSKFVFCRLQPSR